MCRSIRTLFNIDPPASDDEVRAATVQFVRKISGFTKPSRANEAVFNAAIEDMTRVANRLLFSLQPSVPPRDREAEAAKNKARSLLRFGK
jgi:hypothetical protein